MSGNWKFFYQQNCLIGNIGNFFWLKYVHQVSLLRMKNKKRILKKRFLYHKQNNEKL